MDLLNWFAAHGVELVGFLLTLIVTIVGWVTEHRSAKRLDEERGNDIELLKGQVKALREQAKSLREQTEMQRAEYEKAPWGDAERIGKSGRFLIRNESARAVVVTKLHATDRSLDRLIVADDAFPHTYESGDMIVYLALGTLQTGTPDTVIEWHWADSDEPRTSTRPNLK